MSVSNGVRELCEGARVFVVWHLVLQRRWDRCFIVCELESRESTGVFLSSGRSWSRRKRGWKPAIILPSKLQLGTIEPCLGDTCFQEAGKEAQ